MPSIRPYRCNDEDAVIELWRRSWQQHYPRIDFSQRMDWWRQRWRCELVPNAAISIAEQAGAIVGFVTVDPRSGYLDQIVVAPELWGSAVAPALMAQARVLSPGGLSLKVNADNARAIRFYEKQGFVDAGGGINEISGAPVRQMRWQP
ncbi:MAG: GNAT family N-acetyltransferase [Hyphomicrobiales bacterium]|nr:GNAT family N-acetyltransferase [Hyphomicrobiales bacterium]